MAYGRTEEEEKKAELREDSGRSAKKEPTNQRTTREEKEISQPMVNSFSSFLRLLDCRRVLRRRLVYDCEDEERGKKKKKGSHSDERERGRHE